MAKPKERGEDLNPRDEDVDEKIRRLLDPDLPDEPDESKVEVISEEPKIVPEKASEVIKDEEKTAPELGSPKKGRKVIVPISHDSGDEPDAESAETTEDNEVPEDEKPVLKISINDDGESDEDLAEKLDEAIAVLGEDSEEDTDLEITDENDETIEEQTAPELEDDSEEEPDEDVDDDAEDVTEEDTEEEDPSEEVAEKVQVTKKTKTKTKEKQSKKDDLPEPELVASEDTEKAVKAIVAEEGDDLLEIEDAAKDIKIKPKTKSKGRKKAVIRFFKRLLILVIISAIAALMIIPSTRYKVLNKLGVRSSSSLKVVDTTSQLPLKGATVTLGDKTVETDEEGVATFEGLLLGDSNLKIERLAFGTIEESLTIGWGSNPLGTKFVKPTGSQYKLVILDFASDKAIKGAKINSEYAGAPSDKDGKAVLTVPPLEKDDIEVEVSADGYRTEKIIIRLDSTEDINVRLTPSKKHAFISKRSGKYDLYSVYVDGKGEKLILEASGNETESIDIASHPTKNLIAFVATRAGNKSVNGVIQSDLMLIDLDSGDKTPITSSEKVQLLGWSGDNLVYFTDDRALQKDSQEQSKLYSYDQSSGKGEQIASTSYFNDAILAVNKVYFAPAPNSDGEANLFIADANGKNKKTLFNGEVWNIVRSSASELSLYTNGGEWYSYKLGSSSVSKLDNKPANQKGYIYLSSPDSKASAWVDQRDGKGVLVVSQDADDKVVVSATGITRPLAWIGNSSVIYRVDSPEETADYVVNLDGGKPLKITDVTNTSGTDDWYYY